MFKYLILILFPVLSFASTKLISVTGECSVSGVPDRFRISASLFNENMDQLKASKDLDKRNNETIKKIKDLKLKDLNLRTVDYGLHQIRVWENNKQVFKGYKASTTLHIEFSDKEKIGETLGSLTSLKVDDINGPDTFFSNSKKEELVNECLVMALKNAENKAKLMAKTLNAKIKKVHRIQENKFDNIGVPRESFMLKTAQMNSAPQIEVGTSEFRKEIFVEFELD